MHRLSAQEVLEVWERALAAPANRRPLILLEAAADGASADDLASLSIGQRDALLLELRKLTFGEEIAGVTECGSCGETLDLTFRTSDVGMEPGPVGGPEFTLAVSGYKIRFRLPDSTDLEAAAEAGGAAGARSVLLSRCVLEADECAEARSCADLPPGVVQELTREMARLDPQAEVRILVRCPRCGHSTEPLFDIAVFLWNEVAVLARRLLREVHMLASHYGWPEAEILAMSAFRRSAYVEMIGA